MTQAEGEARIKVLQREYLTWVEDNPLFLELPPLVFNDIRKRVFRATFEAFRLGKVGLSQEQNGLWGKFFGWAPLLNVNEEAQLEIQSKCFLVTLEAFRIGALTAG
jgi:hypothetical protein